MVIIEFKGFEKVGIDTCALLHLANCPSNLDDFIKNYGSKNQVFYHTSTIHHEIIGVLIHNYFFDYDDAKLAWQNLVKSLNSNIIYWHKNYKEEIEIKVRETNEEIVKLFNDKKLRIGEPDIKIICCYIYEGINKVYTLDRGFEKTCIMLGMSVLKLPREYIVKSAIIRKMNKKILG
jgi:hypothetical protein